MTVTITNEPVILKNAEEAATRAAELAANASVNGTFGVGGLLVNSKTGAVLAVALNHVMQNGKVVDPTAHVERQLVDWYFEQTIKERRDLPTPGELTIVSSLDPCMMCCGAILKSGFNVTSVALDDFAGVNYNGGRKFSALPNELKLQAQQALSYLGINGKREFDGSLDSLFVGSSITESTAQRSIDAIVGSLSSVKDSINAAELLPGQLKNPADLSENNPVVLALRGYDADALTVRTSYTHPDDAILRPLLDKASQAKQAGNSHNSVALIDTFGNVLMTMAGKESQSPIRTAFMELTRAYAKIRAEVGVSGAEYLPHPKFLKFVALKGPGRDAESIMDLGAYGSTMEGPVPESNSRSLQYIVPQQDQHALEAMMREFPPLYRDVIQICPAQVENKALKIEADKTLRGMSKI